MEKISKYKKQIATFITITLLVTYGIFPALTAANTFLNILGGIGALLFLIWGGLSLYDYVNSSNENPYPSSVDETITESPKVVKMTSKPKKGNSKKSEFPMPPHNPTRKTKKTK
jgi:purine-cytosine permease-like protein